MDATTKSITRFALIFLFFAIPALAQRTVVSGTVKDPNGTPYAGGTMIVTLSLPVGASGAVLNGVQIAGATQRATLDNTGSFLMQLPDNAVVQCTNSVGQIIACVPQTQWTFNVNLSPGILPPAGSGPQSCILTTGVTGAAQTVTFSGCPTLSNFTGTAYLANAQNVVTNGAVGDAQESSNFTITAGLTQTCTDCAFVASRDTGKEIACGLNGATQLARTTITSVVNSTTITTAIGGNNTPAVCAWGTSSTVNDAAFAKTQTAFLAQLHSRISAGILGGPYTGAPVFYVPSGGYLLCNFGWAVTSASGGAAGDLITGDTQDGSTVIYESGCNAGGSAQALLNITGSVQDNRIEHLRFDGMRGSQAGTSFGTVLLLNGSTSINYVTVQRFSIVGITSEATLFSHDGLFVAQNGSVGIACLGGCGGSIDNGGSSNNAAANLLIQNVVGENTGGGFRVGKGWLNDECGGAACAQLINAHDIWFEGASFFGAPVCVSVDGNSFLHWLGGICGTFGNDTNSQGIVIATGGQVQSSDVRYVSSGTGKCINNSGSFYNNGGNSCESQFPIVSGTSTGTAAVLTVTPSTVNANVNCAVGDSLIVEGTTPGYNGYFPFGITAVTATTISYTTVGSNLGAAAASGAAYCRNMITYAGNLPVPLLTPSVTNFSEGVVNLAASTVGTWTPPRGMILTRIQATNTAGTITCATPLVFQFSNGTSTQNLTLTSGQSSWDTGVVSTFFKPNVTNTFQQTAAAACATPPVNLNFSILWGAGLDN